MADRALTEEAMLTGLRDIHLPGDAAGGTAADLLAAAAIGLLLAFMLGALLKTFTVSPRVREFGSDALSDDIDRVQALYRLKLHHPDRFARFRPLLYRRGDQPDRDTVLRELRRHD